MTAGMKLKKVVINLTDRKQVAELMRVLGCKRILAGSVSVNE